MVKDQWVMDSGCTYHMCTEKEWFKNFKVEDHEHVYMGKNNHCRVKGTGSIRLKLNSGKLVTLSKSGLSQS